ncbi:tyrosine-type recombinase/integrase [Brevibacillus gelatini]|nr:tyrosine-type recombinase/integrase [Brevibacillus gelatini]
MIANVAELHVNNVYNDIQTFFSEELKTDNTRRAYRTDIEYFFQYMRNKHLNQLHLTDLWFEYKDVLRYRNHLRNKLGKKSSVNRKISSLRKLYKYLAKNNYNVNAHAFEVDDLDTDDTDSSGVLSVHEVETMIQLVKELPNGEEKSIFIDLAYSTSIRVSALLSLKWKQIKFIKNGQWEIRLKDKGKENVKGIPDELYQMLLMLKRDNDERVFTMSYTTVYDTIKELCAKMGIPEHRNITPHSLKKVLIDWTVETTKDVKLAAWQGNHSLDVMYKHYLSKNVDYENTPAFMVRKKNDLSPIEVLSREELIELIKRSSRAAQNELLSLLKQEK